MLVMRAHPSREVDQRLVERCQQGDRAAQVELFRGERQRVHALLHRVLGTNAAMDDLIQDTFIRVFRALPQFRGESQLSTWIGRIALRVAYEHIRNKRPAGVKLESVPELPDDDPDAEQQLAAREAVRRLYEILERLDVKMRVAFALHVIDGRPLAEVAVLMSATVMATKARVWRARREVEKRARRDPWLAAFVDASGGVS
jgi:RNA polymerase sigma-70 factor (ECF subfamily)